MHKQYIPEENSMNICVSITQFRNLTHGQSCLSTCISSLLATPVILNYVIVSHVI